MKALNRWKADSNVLKASLFLLLISPVVISGVAQASPSGVPAACTESSVVSQINNTKTGIDSQSATNLAKSAPRYNDVTKDAAAVSSKGMSNGWTIDPTTCVVSWQNLAVNFYMKVVNGSAYTISVTENPRTGVVHDVSVSRAISAGITINGGKSYSGYGIAGTSAPYIYQLYQAQAYFYQPTVSMPPTQDRTPHTCDVWHAGSYNPAYACLLSVWAGLANSQYTGPGSVSSGGVVQTGTLGEVLNNSFGHTVSITYLAWSEDFESSNSNNNIDPCPSTDTVSTSQDFTSNVENQRVANGTSGSNYYTYLTDWGGYWVCTHHYVDSFTPVYANFIAERNGNGTVGTTETLASLPAFSAFNLYDCAMYYGSFAGVYPYYNNGDGFGVEMFNVVNINTYTSAMNQIGNGYGNFSETYHNSFGT
jgi:hypothetical protein